MPYLKKDSVILPGNVLMIFHMYVPQKMTDLYLILIYLVYEHLHEHFPFCPQRVVFSKME